MEILSASVIPGDAITAPIVLITVTKMHAVFDSWLNCLKFGWPHKKGTKSIRDKITAKNSHIKYYEFSRLSLFQEIFYKVRKLSLAFSLYLNPCHGLIGKYSQKLPEFLNITQPFKNIFEALALSVIFLNSFIQNVTPTSTIVCIWMPRHFCIYSRNWWNLQVFKALFVVILRLCVGPLS